jgi:hypothetical protein
MGSFPSEWSAEQGGGTTESSRKQTWQSIRIRRLRIWPTDTYSFVFVFAEYSFLLRLTNYSRRMCQHPYSFVFVFVEYEYSSVLFVYIRITAELTANANIRMAALVFGQDRAI